MKNHQTFSAVHSSARVAARLFMGAWLFAASPGCMIDFQRFEFGDAGPSSATGAQQPSDNEPKGEDAAGPDSATLESAGVDADVDVAASTQDDADVDAAVDAASSGEVSSEGEANSRDTESPMTALDASTLPDGERDLRSDATDQVSSEGEANSADAEPPTTALDASTLFDGGFGSPTDSAD